MATPSPLDIVLTDAIVRGLAGGTYYQRGVDYFRRDLVVSLEQSGNIIEAIVSGTEDYTVRFSITGKRFKYTCECPLGGDGAFCKHCVATALAWLADKAGAAPAPKTTRSKPITDEDIRAALRAEAKEVLVDWLMEWSQQDKTVRQRLAAIARLRSDPAARVDQVAQELQDAIKIRRFVEYREAGAYAGRVLTVLDEVETLLRQGHAAPVIGLCEAAMGWLETAIGHIDDSGGQCTELIGRIAELHLQACEQAKPDPEALGATLFSLEVNGEYSQWSGAAERYTHLLGEKGLAAFREAAAQAWAKVPPRTGPRNDPDDVRYYGITYIMESLARQSGDVEQLVSVWERDLTFANQYARIAGAYRNAGKHEKALEWAEKGMALYLDHRGAALRLFVAEEYRRTERHADALRILWSEFRGAPCLNTYKLLEDFARAADDWDDWRDRTLAHIRRTIEEKPPNRGSVANGPVFRWQQTQGHSLLVEIFLHEQNVEHAWHAAQTGGCSNTLWLQLAAARETTHPEDAIAVYLRLGEQAVADTSNGRYEPAVALLEKAAALMHSLGRSHEFEFQFDALRQRFKVKRNLQKLAEARRKSLYLQYR